jgi:Cell morphogenesis central region
MPSAQGSKGRARREELRLVAANTMRAVAASLRPGQLRRDAPLRARLLEFIVETSAYVRSCGSGAVFRHPAFALQSVSNPRRLRPRPASRLCSTSFLAGTWCDPVQQPARGPPVVS